MHMYTYTQPYNVVLKCVYSRYNQEQKYKRTEREW